MHMQLIDQSCMDSSSNEQFFAAPSMSKFKDRPSKATRRSSGRHRAANLWLSAHDSLSMVGRAPRKRQAIDKYTWGRRALHFAGISVEEHASHAGRLGGGCAAEVLLLAVAQHCGGNKRKWEEARDLGIPWQTETLDIRERLTAILQRRCGQSAAAAQLRQ